MQIPKPFFEILTLSAYDGATEFALLMSIWGNFCNCCPFIPLILTLILLLLLTAYVTNVY